MILNRCLPFTNYKNKLPTMLFVFLFELSVKSIVGSNVLSFSCKSKIVR